MSSGNTLIVAGGGTGGHVLAGTAVADTWKEKTGGEVCFVGAAGGIEEKLVPRAGYSLQLLKLGSLNRVSLKRKLLTLFQLPLAFVRSVTILRQKRPKAVFGVGGYSSGPVLLMARILRAFGLLDAKVAIIEQNAVPGLTNRILCLFSDVVFSAFPGAEERFRSKKVVFTGNPVRSTMKRLPPATRNPFTIFVFGGSQGAMGINSLILDALPLLSDLQRKLMFIHQTGEKDYDRVKAGHQTAGSKAVVEKFIHNMPAAYGEASLLVCRAGSSTLAEIAAVGRAAVLVPFPFAADNHQEKNAKIFVDAGAAFLLPQFKTKGEDLAKLIRQCIESPAILDQMENAVTRFYKPDAAKDVVAGLLE